MIRTSLLTISVALIAPAITPSARADFIPYPNLGRYNATSYSFVAASTGDVIGYFAGSDATYENRVGLLVNGVLTSAGYGLDDHTSSIGQAFDFGHVNAGDSLVFDLNVLTLGAHVYSNPSLNVAFDDAGETVGHNHLYSTPYTATSPVIGNIPRGVYVAFEDQRFPSSDFSYADENFVFTNVTTATTPEPASWILLGLGLCGALVGAERRSLRRRPHNATSIGSPPAI